MPRISIWWKLASLGLVAYLAVALFCGTDAVAQKDDKDKDKDKDKKVEKPKDGPTKAYYGILGCGMDNEGCHGREANSPQPMGKRKNVHRQNEVRYWLKNDKHATAYRVLITDKKDAENYIKLDESRYTEDELKEMKDRDTAEGIYNSNTRARQMEKILAETERGKQIAMASGGTYKLIKDPDCLACHAQVIPKNDDDRNDKNKKDEDKTVKPSFHEEEGVNCVVCHGPYKEWVFEHTGILGGPAAWRALSRETKETQKGLTDLWDPARRTKLCASCHIGHQGDGKLVPRRFVTHEMYAAGHPPLPGFEVATFSNEMPRHWDYLREKSDTILKILDRKRADVQAEQTQLVLIGAATSLAEQMRLVVSQADHAVKNQEMLDLSNFDCFACHHGLVSDAWRQKRGYGKHRPGRLPMRPWATELIKLAIHFVETDKAEREKREAEYDKKVDAVKEAFTSRMYGNTKEIDKNAKDLAAWADKLAADVIKKAGKEPPTEKVAKEMYEAIPEVYRTKDERKWVDYDSARQVGWGFKVMYYEVNKLDWDPKKRDKSEHKADVKAVLTQIDDLGKKLKLDLPTKPKSIDDDLDQTLEALNKYKPIEFNAQLLELGKSLNQKK